ncbi:hypothetical protein BB559_001478 [Furculomyces boomerangus]|uniref:Uncharacterized protein n=1 Tax=Furculomyces boomerangus TaxID=61424 RepID=A0A2T9Z1W5_9FUNG|nr:hypothetical protein BB559_001478 [Furculomyces boomerangus]
MSSNTATIIDKIDTNRCLDQWSLIQKHAKKYSKYTGKDNSPFEQLLNVEAQLEAFLLKIKWNPNKHWANDGKVYLPKENSTPKSLDQFYLNFKRDGKKMWISFPALPKTSKDLIQVESSLLKIKTLQLTSDERWQLEIILAKVYYYLNEVEKCENSLKDISNTYTKSPLCPVYGLRLFIAAMTMKGMILEKKSAMNEALSIYNSAVNSYKAELGPNALLVVGKNGIGSNEETINWAEEMLYRKSMIAISELGENGIESCNEYLKTMELANPNTLRLFRRAVMIRTMIRVVSELYRDGLYETWQDKLRSENQKRKTFRSYIMDLHNLAFEFMKQSTSFPDASRQNMVIVEESIQSVSDWKLARGNSLADIVQLLRIQYECARLTFNSVTIMRNLVNTLFQFGDYHEAYLAANTYSELIRRVLENRRKDFITLVERFGTDKKNLTIGLSECIDEVESEDVSDIVETLTTGIHIMVSHMGKPKEALKLYNLVSEIANEKPNTICIGSISENVPKYLLAKAEIGKGMIHGIFSRSEHSPDKRCESHDIAISSFTKAVEMCEESQSMLDPNSHLCKKTVLVNAEAKFYLGLQYAVGGRNITDAINQIKKALSLNPKSVRSWHLLALLVSSAASKSNSANDTLDNGNSRNSRLNSAMKVCEIGLRQNEWWWQAEQELLFEKKETKKRRDEENERPSSANPGTTISSLLPIAPIDTDVLIPTGVTAEEGIEYMKLRLLHFVIQRELEGPESVLNSMSLLFQLYSKICGPIQALPPDLHDASKFLLIINEQAQVAEVDIPKKGFFQGSEKGRNIGTSIQTAGVLSVISAGRLSSIANIAGFVQPKTLAKSLARNMLSVRSPVALWKQGKNQRQQSNLKQDVNGSINLPELDESLSPSIQDPMAPEKMSRKKRIAGKFKNSVKKSFASKSSKRAANTTQLNIPENENRPKITLQWPSSLSSAESDVSGSSSESETSLPSSDESINSIYIENNTRSEKSTSLVNENINEHEIHTASPANHEPDGIENIPSKQTSSQGKNAKTKNPLDIIMRSNSNKEGDNESGKKPAVVIDEHGFEVGTSSFQPKIEEPPSTSVAYFNAKSQKDIANNNDLIPGLNEFNFDTGAAAIVSRNSVQYNRNSMMLSKTSAAKSNIAAGNTNQIKLKLDSQSVSLKPEASVNQDSLNLPSSIPQSLSHSRQHSNVSNKKSKYVSLSNSVSGNSPALSQETTSSTSPYTNVYFKPTTTRLRRCRSLASELLSKLWLFSSECFMLLGRYDEGLVVLSDAAMANPLEPKIMLIRSQIFLAQASNERKDIFGENKTNESNLQGSSDYYPSFSINPKSETFVFSGQERNEKNKNSFYKLEHNLNSSSESLNLLDKKQNSEFDQNRPVPGFNPISESKTPDSRSRTGVSSSQELLDNGSYNLTQMAISELRSASSLAPHNPDVLVSLSRLEWKLGHWEIAYGLVSEVTQGVGWSNPEAWFILGLLEKQVAMALGKVSILPPILNNRVEDNGNKVHTTNIPKDTNNTSKNLTKFPENFDKPESFTKPGVIPEEDQNLALINEHYVNYSATDDKIAELSESITYMDILTSTPIEKARLLSNMPASSAKAQTSTRNSSFVNSSSYSTLDRVKQLNGTGNKKDILSMQNRNGVSDQSENTSNASSVIAMRLNGSSTSESNYSAESSNHDKPSSPGEMNVQEAWQRVRHFLSFALELEETQPIEPYESVLLF